MIDVLTGVLGAMVFVGGFRAVAGTESRGRLTDHGAREREWLARRPTAVDIAVVLGLALLEVFAVATVVAVWNAPLPVAFQVLSAGALLVGTALVLPAQVRRFRRVRDGTDFHLTTLPGVDN